jgi:hypothetical protein
MTTPTGNVPAFPVKFNPLDLDLEKFTPDLSSSQCRGMSLRDWFAGQALKMIVLNDVSGRPDNFRQFYSEGAYEWADAMLAARQKGIQ